MPHTAYFSSPFWPSSSSHLQHNTSIHTSVASLSSRRLRDCDANMMHPAGLLHAAFTPAPLERCLRKRFFPPCTVPEPALWSHDTAPNGTCGACNHPRRSLVRPLFQYSRYVMHTIAEGQCIHICASPQSVCVIAVPVLVALLCFLPADVRMPGATA